VDELFPSNFSGFSIFSLEVLIRASFAGHSGARAAAIPAPTSLAISSGVSIVANWALVGSPVPDGGLPAVRFCMYRLSSSLPRDGMGKGDLDSRSDLGGVPPPLSPLPPAAGHGGSSGSDGLVGGSAGRLCLRAWEAEASQIGLRSVGWAGSGGGAAGAEAALVLGGLTGIRHSCRGCGDGALSSASREGVSEWLSAEFHP